MTTINNFCTGCGQSIHPTATACPHCGAPQAGANATPLITAQTQTYVSSTHLFLITDTTFNVRWTYWVWWGLAAVSFIVSYFSGGASYLFGCVVMPYLIVSSLIKRKQWQHQQLLDAVEAGKRP